MPQEVFKTFEKGNFKSFFLENLLEGSKFPPVNKGIDHKATGRRLRILRHLVAGSDNGAATRFVDMLGIENSRWSNLEHGLPLQRDLAAQLIYLVPGLTMDWLWLGRVDGMPTVLQRELLEAEKAVTLVEGSASTKKRKTRSRA